MRVKPALVMVFGRRMNPLATVSRDGQGMIARNVIVVIQKIVSIAPVTVFGMETPASVIKDSMLVLMGGSVLIALYVTGFMNILQMIVMHVTLKVFLSRQNHRVKDVVTAHGIENGFQKRRAWAFAMKHK